jgi:FKBP-type peptidyl-prolyl cis-trans isomerase
MRLSNKAQNIIGAVALILVVGLIVWGGMRSKAETAAENATPRTITMQNNLKITDTKVGTGSEAKLGDTVMVHYTGTFLDGSVFDSSVPRGQPFSFTLGEGRVIAGWEQGVLGMKAGGKRSLSIPPELGYGMNDYGPIPGGSTLLFDIELLGIEGK